MDDARRCHAKSKQSQQRCKRAAIRGAAVCNIHGGYTPLARMAAEERIRALVDPALVRITRTIDDDDNPQLALAAARDILDRAGYKPKEKIESTGEQTIRVEYADTAPKLDFERTNGHG